MRRPRHGFTFTEVMVAMVVLLLLFLVLSSIFQSSRQVVNLGTAQAEVQNYARALETNLRKDLRQLSAEGFVVVSSRNVTGPDGVRRAQDDLLFFSNGDFTSLQRKKIRDRSNVYVMPPLTRATSARVWYGFLDLKQGTLPEHKMALGRQALLLNGRDVAMGFHAGDLRSVLSPTIWDNNETSDDPSDDNPVGSRIVDGQLDVANTTIVDIRRQIELEMTNTGKTMYERMWESSALRPYGKQFLQYKDDATAQALPAGTTPNEFDSEQLMYLHALLAPNCSSFRVHFAGDYDGPGGTPDGKLDRTGTGDVIWYGLYNTPQPSALGADRYAKVTGNIVLDGPIDESTAGSEIWPVVFGYDRVQTPWPQLLRVTVNLHDTEGRLHDFHRRHPDSQDGRIFTFVIDLKD